MQRATKKYPLNFNDKGMTTDSDLIAGDNPITTPLPNTPSQGGDIEIISDTTNSPMTKQDEEDDVPETDKSLSEVLERVFSFINLSAKKPHEILQGLADQGVTDWNAFMYMEIEDIKLITMGSRYGIKRYQHHPSY